MERKGQRTQRRILEAARHVFGKVGYERATIRAIADAADVDKSSVMQYFGTKRELFRQAVHWDFPDGELAADQPARSVENYLRAMLCKWAADPDGPMSVLLRASLTSEDAAQILRDHAGRHAIEPVAAQIPGDDARLRAVLSGAMMMGIAAQRYLLKMPGLADADVEDIIRIAVPVFRDLIVPQEARDGAEVAIRAYRRLADELSTRI